MPKWLKYCGASVFLLGSIHCNPNSNPSNDNRLLNNIDTLKATVVSSGQQASIAELKAELLTLWDWTEQGQKPLDIEIVTTEIKNGYKIEGLYFNGYGDSKGQDRIFCYYARPEKIEGKIPVHIELTGGAEPEACLWMTKAYKCAIMNFEWRATKNRFRSKWACKELGSMKDLTFLKQNAAFRIVTGIRRSIDFLAQQSALDMDRLSCGGGSMGGYYTMLSAGVDQRIRFGMNELGGGYLSNTDSSLGGFKLDPERKQIWIQAFDPYTYAGKTKATIRTHLSANDYFFWLGDVVENYKALNGEKSLCISPNYNHNDGAFGRKKYDSNGWLDYCFGFESNFPKISALKNEGLSYTVTLDSTTQASEVKLLWSPGVKVIWPARYWVEVNCVKTAKGWTAELPASYAKLSRMVFATASDAKGRVVSCEPMLTKGDDPQDGPSPLWPEGQIWDAKAGVSAWRLIGPNVHSGCAGVELTSFGMKGITLKPKGPKNSFSLVTNSLILASGSASLQAGLKMGIDGNGKSGKLKVTLVRNFGAASQQQEFLCEVNYNASFASYELPWENFKAFQASSSMFPFESLRLDGESPDGTALTISSLDFMPTAR